MRRCEGELHPAGDRHQLEAPICPVHKALVSLCQELEYLSLAEVRDAVVAQNSLLQLEKHLLRGHRGCRDREAARDRGGPSLAPPPWYASGGGEQAEKRNEEGGEG